ncbi:MAG: hypothetical protein HOW73_03940 [Polyangiaceae bacterium]|nr:hypothetical protein [Polyangiaceae bacterium]
MKPSELDATAQTPVPPPPVRAKGFDPQHFVVGVLLPRLKPYAIPLLISSILAYFATRAILHDAGQPGMPLDDSYIHFVYARRFAEGRPFTFGLGDGFSSGATSFLWPLVLSPFYLFGFRGLSLVYVVWVLGTLLHAAVAVETKRLAEGIAGKAAGVGAAAMSLFFGAFAWFAWSGMETVGLAWAMTRTIRMSSDLAETPAADRTTAQLRNLGVMAAIAALVRPEGGAIALVAAIAILVFNRKGLAQKEAIKARLPAFFPLAAIAWVPIVNLLTVGHTRSTTTMVKWAVGNPYFPPERLSNFVRGNMGMLVEDLLSGGPYTAIFVPEYTHYVLFGGSVSLIVLAILDRKFARGLFIAALVLGTLIPCTFITILWNRVRYIWPFAPGWFVLVACLGAALGRLFAKLYKETSFVPALVTGIYAGALATKLGWSIADLANSSRAITEQQVKLGVWAEENLPKDALIGLNDTGAIAYFSERRTFDVVGLTTEGEAQYWVAGSGSRYEHYENLGPSKLPTHFIVYPQWFGLPSVLGPELYEATVLNQSILGGATKVVYEADWSVLGRGDRPTLRDRPAATIVDVLDVSDLESEKAHGYRLFYSTELDNLVTTQWNEDGNDVTDGGRLKRSADEFELDFTGTTTPTIVARLSAPAEVRLLLKLDGAPVSNIEVPATGWAEVEVALPRGTTGKHQIRIEAPSAEIFGSMHYWLFSE